MYNDGWDNEVSWSKDEKTILFQGHPESGHEETKNFFNTVVRHCMEIQ